MDAMDTQNLSGANWSATVERAIIASIELGLMFASIYLTVCYGLPSNALEFIKENI